MTKRVRFIGIFRCPICKLRRRFYHYVYRRVKDIKYGVIGYCEVCKVLKYLNCEEMEFEYVDG